ncbi:ABC transporter permease [Cohnella mopanensis]|uniref:ABC transporter permease n=1 Tax=Cohnella mopanensis TaxID=2911966 RepID=UPI001EF7CDFB|nr:ABC transporter permease [Cohnella mopanensis]
MHAFRRLLLTELRNRRNTTLITLGATLFLNALIMIVTYQADLYPDQLGFVMTLNIVVLVAMLLIPFLHGFTAWREEWKNQSIYQLLTLPVLRTHLLFAKYISILLESVLILILTFASLWLQYELSDGQLYRAEPLTTFDWSKALFVSKLVLSAIGIISLCSLSILLGKWIRKLSLLVTFLSLASGMLVSAVIYATLPSVFSLFVLVVAFIALSYYLLDKKVDVS